MNRILNKSCLQKPKQQTRSFNKSRPRPHFGCPENVRDWLKKEEQAIDDKFKLVG